MKKVLYGILSLAFLFACDMEELPKAEITSDPVFGTETGLQMYTNSFYEVFPTTTSRYTISNYIAVNQVIKYLTSNGFSPEESSGWNWGTLRNINYFIVNCTDEALPAATRNNYLGVARFFRAYFYFDMMKRFGDLPWINHPLDVNDPLLHSVRDSRSLIADSIKADLDFAIANIKTSKDASCSTITSTVAAAMKSRVCLWEGTFRKYHAEAGLQSSANQWLQEAADAAQIVMNAGYSIYTGSGVYNSYRNLFISKSPVSAEVLYAVTFDSSLGVVHSSNRQWTSVTFGVCPSLVRPFVNTYLMLDGTSFTDQSDYATKSFTEECVNRDTRLAQTVRTPGFTRVTGGTTVKTPPNYAYAITGYQTSKFTLDDTQYDNVDICDNNVILFRYAEVLLNYAEAKAELGMLTNDDWTKTVGTLRARAGITNGLTAKPTTIDSYLQQTYFPAISDPTLLEVRRERSIELALEGFRYTDLLRWKKGELMTQKWRGIYVKELNVPMDLDHDGALDVVFYQGTKPENLPSTCVAVNVSASETNQQGLSEGDHGYLTWSDNLPRYWYPDNRQYYYPIPSLVIVKNLNLEQNPGWE